MGTMRDWSRNGCGRHRRGGHWLAAGDVHRHGAPDGIEDAGHVGQRGVFVDGIVADHHVALRDEHRRRLQRGPQVGLAHDVGDDHLADRTVLGVLLHDDEAAGFADGSLDHRLVPRGDRAQVDEIHPDFALQFSDGLMGFLHRVAPGDEREVVALKAAARDTERDGNDRRGGLALGPEHVLGHKEKHDILRMHRGPEQAGGVLGRAGDDDVDAGEMREHRLVGLRVPDAATGQVGAVGRVDDGRDLPLAVGAPAQVGQIGRELVEGGINKIDELDLEHRAAAVEREAAGEADDRGLGQRRVEHLAGKIRG